MDHIQANDLITYIRNSSAKLSPRDESILKTADMLICKGKPISKKMGWKLQELYRKASGAYDKTWTRVT